MTPRADLLLAWASPAELPDRYPGVTFGDQVTVGEHVEIGAGSVVASGVRLYPGTRLGRDVTVLENTVIGRPTLVPGGSATVKRTMDAGLGPVVVADGAVIGASVVLYQDVRIGARAIICDLTSVREQCDIGDDVLLGRSVMIQVNTRIGARTKIMDTCHMPGDMVVEEDVFISTHVCGASENSMGRTDMSGAWTGPMIRRWAYIGVNATLLPGVEIGEHAVVGAGALVTRSVPPRCLVMGVPARVVRAVEPRDT